MRPDDPGTVDADGARTAGLWSYDGGWSTPAGEDPGPAPDEAPSRRRGTGRTRPTPSGDEPSGDPADVSVPDGRAGSARRGGVGGRPSRDGRRAAGRGGFGETRERGDRRGSRSADRGGDGTGAGAGPPGDPEAVARAVCLRLLTMQPRTRSELATALAKRGVPDEAAETVLSRFTEVGLIDDRAFAAAWVDSRHAGRGLARRALAAELRRRGIDGEVVGEAVAVVDADAEERAARQLVARRLAATRRLDQPARIRRLAGMLARKGYPPGLSLRVVREALAAEGTDPGDLDALDDTVPDD